jgi:hypothetical protein
MFATFAWMVPKVDVVAVAAPFVTCSVPPLPIAASSSW